MRIFLIILCWILIGGYSFYKTETKYLNTKEITVGTIFGLIFFSFLGIITFLVYISLKIEESKFCKKVIWKKK